MNTDDARNRILAVAGPIFGEKGFETATVREICEKAGVNLASVNYYFGGKEQLYIEAVRQAQQPLHQQFPTPEWSDGTPAGQKLKDFILTLVNRMVSPRAPWQRQLMMREFLNPSAACEALVHDYFRPSFDLMLGILDEILPEETPQHRRHQFVFSIIGQCLYYHVGRDVVTMLVAKDEIQEYYTPEKLADHISQVCLAALGEEASLADPTRRASQQTT